MSEWVFAGLVVIALATIGTIGSDKVIGPGCSGGAKALVVICR